MTTAAEALRKLGDELAADGWRPFAKILWRAADRAERPECSHYRHFLVQKFNGGDPVWLCEGCRTIVGRVKLDEN